MNGGQSAEQMIYLSLKSSEQIAKLSALGAKHLAALLMALLKEGKELLTNTGLSKILENGEIPAVVPINKEMLGDFKKLANKYSIKFLGISDKETNSVDLVLNRKDAEIINRILERIGYSEIGEEVVADPNGIPLAPSKSESHEQGITSNQNKTRSTSDKPSIVEKVENIKLNLKIQDKGGQEFER
jgi:hypothetical protein